MSRTKALLTCKYSRVEEDERGYIRVYDAKAPEDIVIYLYEGGILVNEIQTAKIDLEEYYIDLMNEKKENPLRLHRQPHFPSENKEDDNMGKTGAIDLSISVSAKAEKYIIGGLPENVHNPAVLYHGGHRRGHSRIGTGDDDHRGRIYIRRSGNRCRNRSGNGVHNKHLAGSGIHQRRKLRNGLRHHEHVQHQPAFLSGGGVCLHLC
ncbi:MAG TPA: hypothetical protein H9694_01915 [Firmicutes bacterium]|nr:hypothetical protein [Bacillota bacterium]